jgi:hypothetical protein
MYFNSDCSNHKSRSASPPTTRLQSRSGFESAGFCCSSGFGLDLNDRGVFERKKAEQGRGIKEREEGQLSLRQKVEGERPTGGDGANPLFESLALEERKRERERERERKGV